MKILLMMATALFVQGCATTGAVEKKAGNAFAAQTAVQGLEKFRPAKGFKAKDAGDAEKVRNDVRNRIISSRSLLLESGNLSANPELKLRFNRAAASLCGNQVSYPKARKAPAGKLDVCTDQETTAWHLP